MAETWAAIEALAVRDCIINRDILLKRATGIQFEGCSILAVRIDLGDELFERVKNFAARIPLAKEPVSITSPVAVTPPFLDGANLIGKFLEDAVGALS